MESNRKYENGFEIKNERGLKLCNVFDFSKLVIGRKEKPRKTDDCIKYICYMYDNKGKCIGCIILKETTIDKMVGE